MLVTQLELAPETVQAWEAAGVRDVDGLCRPVSELLVLDGVSGSMVFETICRLVECGVWRPGWVCRGGFEPDDCDIAILRSRIVDGAPLKEIARQSILSADEVRRRLHLQFGMVGEPPVALVRRAMERLVALRLYRCPDGMSERLLLTGLVPARVPLRRERRSIAWKRGVSLCGKTTG